MTELKAPFPWFGGKSQVAPLVWRRFGVVRNYVEPFMGSLAMLLGRPTPFDGTETVNDADGFVANFWRATAHDPEAVAHYADWPVNECLPAGTMIDTPSGPLAVEFIRPGMIVFGERAGRRVETRVTATKQGEACEFYAVGPVWMTGNHPVWTQELGYVEASRLTPGLHVGISHWAVDEIDIVEIQSCHEQSSLGNLLAGRSTHVGGAVRRSDVPGQGTISRASIAGGDGRQDASGLLDSVADRGGPEADLWRAGAGQRRRMAETGAILDSGTQADADEPHQRRGGLAGLRSDAGTSTEVVRDAVRCTVRTGATRGHARAEAFAGSRGEDQAGQHRQNHASDDENQGFGGSEGQAFVDRASCEAGGCASGQSAVRGASTEDRCFDDQPETGSVRRDRRGLCFGDRGCEGFRSDGGVDQSSHPQGLSLQRQSLPSGVAVYNFQTDTGNYFANGLLVHNCDLHARHSWLVGQRESITARLEGDPDWYDAKVAGWWCWGQCCWIGSGWCSGKGPWQTVEIDGVRQLVHLGDAGRGVNRKLVHLGGGRGVNRKLVHLGDAGRGVNRKREPLYEWFAALADRLRGVRVCCGDWSRVCGPTPTTKQGLTAVFLDPPYADTAGRTADLYANDCLAVAHAVRQWAIERGDDPMMRIALCGYEGEHAMPETWECVPWSARGGYGSQSTEHDNPNARRERIWFSPHCEKVRRQLGLFGEAS